MKVKTNFLNTFGQRGSLALEQILFIGAIVATSVGIFAFYDNISTYFKNIDVSALPTQIDTGNQTNRTEATSG